MRGYDTSAAKLKRVKISAKKRGLKLYLIVANMTTSPTVYRISRGNILITTPPMAQNSAVTCLISPKSMFGRIIMFGMSTITPDDLISGYDIELNRLMDARFNQMLDFSENETRRMIRYYKQMEVNDQAN